MMTSNASAMTRLAPALALLLATVPSTSAFSPSIRAKFHRGSYVKALNYYEPGPNAFTTHDASETYERAVDCVGNFGMCGIDELLDLSEELDEYLGCHVEDGPEACEKEIDDRHELAEALLVQSEMREHDRYVQEGNIFPFASSADNDLDDGAFWGNPRLAP